MFTACAVVGILVATATSTSLYYVGLDEVDTQHRDFSNEVAKLAYRERDDVQVIRDLPGVQDRNRSYRCGFELLHYTLTGVE